MFPELCQMFPESRQMFPESCQMFPESCQMFPECLRNQLPGSMRTQCNTTHIRRSPVRRAACHVGRRCVATISHACCNLHMTCDCQPLDAFRQINTSKLLPH
jgi:hypothetical protein